MTRQLPKRTPHPDAWTITKKNVVAAELARAIRLYLIDDDVVCAHVLACAAREILRAKAKALGLPSAWDQLSENADPEFKRALEVRLPLEYNFFKHGGHKNDDLNEHYTPFMTEFALWECCLNFRIVYELETYEARAFVAWFSSNNPAFAEPSYEELLKTVRASAKKGVFDADGRLTKAAAAADIKLVDAGISDDDAPVLLAMGPRRPTAS